MFKLKKLITSKKGESLIEVVTSCAIFGIVIVAMTSLLMSASSITTEAYRVHKGDNLIADFFDGDGNPVSGTPTATETLTPDTSVVLIKFDSSTGDLQLKADITYHEADPGAGYNLKKITVGDVKKIEP